MPEPIPALLTPAPIAVVAPLCALLLALVCIGAGRRLMRLLGIPTGTITFGESLVIALGLGAGVIQLLPFAAGIAGWLTVPVLRIAVGAVALLLVPDIIAVVKEGTRALGRLRASDQRFGTLLVAALLPGLACAFLVAITPTLDPDGLSYHLTVPKRWIQSGSLGYLPTYPYSNTPMGVQMLYTLTLATGGDSAAKVLHVLLAVAGAWAIYRAGVRLSSAAVGAMSVVLFLAGPAAATKFLGLAYVEGATAFATAATVLAWLLWLRTRDLPWLKAAAMLVGVAISFKLTAVIFAAALVVLTAGVLFDAHRRTGRAPLTPGQLVLLACWGLLPIAPWLVRAAAFTGNPVFPLFAQIIPSRDFSPVTAGMFDEYNRYFLWASRYGLSWSMEFRRMILLGSILSVFAVTLFAYFRARTFLVRLGAIVVGSTFILQLAAAGLYVRYWIPILPVLLLPCLAWAETLWARERWKWALVGAAALGSLVQARSSLGAINFDVGGALRTTVGRQQSTDFLRRHLPLYPLFEAVNRDLPRDARIALSYSCRGFHIDRTTLCTEFPQDALAFHDWEAFASGVERLGITHFMAPTGVASGLQYPAPDYSAPAMMFRQRENEYIHRLLSTRGRVLATAGDQGLFVLEPAAGAR